MSIKETILRDERYTVLSIIFFYGIITTYLAYTTPLIPGEAKILYNASFTISHYTALVSHSIFGGVFGLRAGFVAVSLLDIYLFYLMIRSRFKKRNDILVTLLLFISLPGMIASSVLVSDSPFAILFTLLLIISVEREKPVLSTLSMIALMFTNTAAFSLYLALALYSSHNRKNRLFTISITLFVISIAIGQYPISGKPEGHFLELLGIYAAVFSPLLFIYYFYSLYRSLLESRRDILWYISFTAFSVSLLLSIRQKIHITDFSPYLLVGIPIAAEVYLRSLRVRMKRFQLKYRLAMYVVVSTLAVSSFVLILNRPIYYISKDNSSFFITPVYRVYEKAVSLVNSGSDCYNRKDFPYKYRDVIRFYGLEKECKNTQR